MRAEDVDADRELLTPAEARRVAGLTAQLSSRWRPLPGPQSDAFHSTADILGYGGAAGGGKTDLLLGVMLRQQQRGIIFRREGTQMTGMLDRMREICGPGKGYSAKDRGWLIGIGRKIEFGSVPHLGDEAKYGTCRAEVERLKSLQDWVRAQAQTWNSDQSR